MGRRQVGGERAESGVFEAVDGKPIQSPSARFADCTGVTEAVIVLIAQPELPATVPL